MRLASHTSLFRRLTIAAFAALMLAAAGWRAAPLGAVSTSVVISQVYGAGGNSGATGGNQAASGGGLAVTGSNAALVAGAGVLLLAIGVGVFFFTRRRRTSFTA